MLDTVAIKITKAHYSCFQYRKADFYTTTAQNDRLSKVSVGKGTPTRERRQPAFVRAGSGGGSWPGGCTAMCSLSNLHLLLSWPITSYRTDSFLFSVKIV